MMTKTKTINMLLYDGSLNGVTNISDSAWESGKMYSAPRESIDDLITRADCRKYGVYLLLSDRQVYVGQAVDLERRTKQHLTDKDWWTQVVLMTTKDDSFNASDIDYLEAYLINLAVNAGTSDSDNKKKGNRQKVDEFRQAELEQYLDEALFLLELIGVKVFKKQILKNRIDTKKAINIDTTSSADNAENNKPTKPALPDELSLGPCEFAKTALTNLLDSGYIFSNQQMEIFSSAEGSKPYTTRNLPLFWILNEGESRATCDKNIRSRYWKDEFVSGNYRFLMFSQWYNDRKKGATKENFKAWYDLL